jgi:copper chaperone CopZ
MPELKFTMKGTHCKSCKMLIEDVLEEMNIKVVSIEINEAKKEGRLIVNTEVDPQKIIDTIQAEGDYTVELVK